MKNISFWVGLGIVLTSLIVLAIAVASSRGSSLKTYNTASSEKPKLVFEHREFDWGEIQLEGVYEHRFQLENQGKRTLEIGKFRTSCDCARAKVKIGEEESPEFGMHNPPQWKGEIEPGKTAEIIATYEPKLHPVEGKVERAILFETNDPENPEVVLTIKAEVHPHT